MLSIFSRGLSIEDPIERKLAPTLQLILATLMAASMFTVLLGIVATGGASLTLRGLLPSVLFISAMGVAIWLLRRGHFKSALGIVVTGVMLSLTNSLLSAGLGNNRELLLVSALAITIAGLLMGRRALLIVTGVNIALIVIASTLITPATPPTDTQALALARLVYFILLISLLSFFIDLFSSTLREALNTSIQREKSLDEQREWLQVTLASIGDAVIATDTKARITFINPVAETLTGWQTHEALGRHVDEVFDIFNESTHERAHNPVDRVLSEGVIVALANHTILRAKNGTERPIADSGAPIRDRNQKTIGAVLVFRDTTEEHRAEQILKESEQRFRTMADTTPALVWVSGTDKLCYYFNKQWLDFTGRTMEQEMGNGWTEGVHPDDYDRCIEIYTSSFDNRQPFSMEYRLRRHDGEYRWLLDNGVPRFTEDGEFVGYIGSCIDINDNKEVEQNLRQARAEAETARLNLQNLFMEAPALIGILRGREGRIELFNPRFQELWGYRDVMGKTMREAWPELEGQGYFEFVESVYDTGTPVHRQEFPAKFDRNNDGIEEEMFFNFVYQATHDANGKVDGIAIYGVEVTEQVTARNQAQANAERLRSAEEHLRLMIDSATDYAIFSLDTEGKIMTWNSGAQRVFGYEEAEILGQDGAILFVPEDRAMAVPQRELLKAAETGIAADERWHLRKDDSRFFASGSTHPIQDSSLRGFMKVARDITEIRQAEEERARLLRDREEAVRQREEATVLLDSLFQTAPFGLAFFDPELRFQRVNQALADINGIPLEMHLGHTVSEILPGITEQGRELMFRQVLERRTAVQFEAVGETPAIPDEERYWITSYYPVELRGELLGIGAVVIEITERKRAELRTRLLQEVTAALSEALTPKEVAEAVVNRGLKALGANVGYVSRLTEEGRIELLNRDGIAPELVERFKDLPLHAKTPMSDTIRTGQPVWVETLQEYRQRYPEIAQSTRPITHSEALIFLPLMAHGRVIGGMGMSFRKAYKLDGDEQDFLWLLANQCAQALERARLFESESQSRKQAERNAGWIARLQEVTAALSSAVTTEEVATVIIDNSVTHIGASRVSLILLQETDTFYTLKAHGMPDEYGNDWKRFPVDPDLPITDVVRSQEPLWFETNADRLTRYPATEQFSDFYDGAWGILPLDLTGKTIGALCLNFPDERPISHEDRLYMRTIAEQCSQALERARLYESEQHRAQQLQKLSEAALKINAVLSLEEMLSTITHEARHIIGAHQCVTSLNMDEDWAQAISSVSLSEKYLRWSDYNERPDGSGIYRLVCESNTPMRMTQGELEAHLGWHGFGEYANGHPPMRGWLAAPLTAQDGSNIGLIQLSDKILGEFTEEDESILVQLAQMASIALENTRLYNQAQEAAAYEERQRLARDLHDAVSQTLFSSTTISEALPQLWKRNPESAFEKLNQMVVLNRAAMAEMRSLLLELRPESIVKTSMTQLLTQLIEAAKGRKKITSELHVSDESALLPPDVHIAFYRIAQESINNILKHSGATHFTVELRSRATEWRLRISDNGRGFEQNGSSAGLGLHSMRERAEKIDGHLTVTTQPGEGTQVTLLWEELEESD
jgi:PAS domain S-box-containing protein